MIKEFEYKFVVLLFSLIPISFVFGPTASLINIIIISTYIIYKITTLRNFDFIKSSSFILLVGIYLYLIVNTYISLDYGFSFLRNFGFIRLILLFLAVNYLFFEFKKYDLIFKIWGITILFIVIDSFIEYFSGTNILGYGQDIYANRIVSFFKDEPIVAGYLNGFFFLILGYLFNIQKSQSKYIFIVYLIFTFLFLTCVILTAERSNTIKAIIGLSLFFFLCDKFKVKYKIIAFFTLIIVLTTLILNSDYLKYRYYKKIIYPILNSELRSEYFKENIYIKHYKSGYAVFKNYPLMGVGNKNYRIETRTNHLKIKNYIPDTHPHQIYFEFLSEHGIIGTIILLSIFFYIIFQNLKICIQSQNSLQLGAFCYLIINFIPILPSGSFFSDFNITLFFINFSIFLACNPSSNIFTKIVKEKKFI